MANVKDTLKSAGEAIKEKAGEAKNWVCETTGACSTSPADVKPHMDVISSCGCHMGKVDHVEGSYLKLTKSDSPDGQHHFVPTAWIDHVDNHVHLNRNADDTRQNWSNAPTATSA